ncbi:MAG: ABC transporter ATP-binding protein, partial [Candidatus Heimdallarchaeota archaeon]
MSHGPGRSRSGPRGGGPMRGMMNKEKAKDFKGTMKLLIQYIGKFKGIILVAFIIAAASTAASIVGPKILGKATTELFIGLQAKIQGTGSIDFIYIRNIILIVAALYFGSAI